MMTTREAIALLGDDLSEIEESLEEKLFALKNQILSFVPIKKLLYPRIKKIHQLNEAYALLGGVEINEVEQTFDFTLSDSIAECFLKYQELHGKIRLALLNALTTTQSINYANYLMRLELVYASYWRTIEFDENVIISKSPDPMEMLSAIRTYNANGGITFEDLKSDKNNPPEMLIKERNRLSLLVTKYSE